MTAARTQRRDAGVTLIELVAVLAIFAMVALMGLQSLTGVIRARERLDGVSDESAALERTLILLRADLAAAVPLTFRPPGGEAEAALLTRPADRALALSVSAPDVLPGEPGDGLSRVIWSHDPVDHRLSRRIWPVLTPENDDLRGPAVSMLGGVESFDIRVLPDAGAGWSPEYGTEPARDPARLPRAVELRLGTQAHGALRLLVVF